jgi:hypothetical protein
MELYMQPQSRRVAAATIATTGLDLLVKTEMAQQKMNTRPYLILQSCHTQHFATALLSDCSHCSVTARCVADACSRMM